MKTHQKQLKENREKREALSLQNIANVVSEVTSEWKAFRAGYVSAYSLFHVYTTDDKCPDLIDEYKKFKKASEGK